MSEDASGENRELLQGTLDLLVLRTVSLEPLHAYGMAQRIGQLTGGAFEVSGGSLFPALRRLERKGHLEASWGVTDTGRRAKFYRLTESGKESADLETDNWERVALGIGRLLEATR